jgi:hypothetical protein
MSCLDSLGNLQRSVSRAENTVHFVELVFYPCGEPARGVCAIILRLSELA